jgi:hypothetical protein
LRFKTFVTASVLVAAVALLAAACGGKKQAAPPPPPKPRCAYRADWQSLANRMRMPVYCPGWLPDPLTSQIGSQWNSMSSITPRSNYVESFIWQDTDTPGLSGVLHVILHGYPHRTTIPTCLSIENAKVPCFGGPKQVIVRNGIHARLYTVNQDFDTWHLALLWRHAGNVYVISQHLAAPLTYAGVLNELTHELKDLVLVEPATIST